MIPLPHTWPSTWVEAPMCPPQRLMQVTVTLTDDSRVSFTERFASSMDAYDAALHRYGECLRIEVEPVSKEPKPGLEALS